VLPFVFILEQPLSDKIGLEFSVIKIIKIRYSIIVIMKKYIPTNVSIETVTGIILAKNMKS